MKKIFSVFILVLWSVGRLSAQADYAYVYIEGDMETPFYVKVEGKMHPRLGKNHFIIANLDEGYTKFEILFQQNKYPPQEFLLEIPASGSRGFRLHKINDRQFALYDLQQSRYIVSGNTEADDSAPVVASLPAGTNTPTATEPTGELPEFPVEGNRVANEVEKATSEKAPEEVNRFVPGLTLYNDGTYSRVPDLESTQPPLDAGKKKRQRAPENFDELPAWDPEAPEARQAANREVEDVDALAATGDCREAMDNLTFENFALKILDKSSDSDRLKLLKRQKARHCFSTEQIRILVKNLNMQSIRFDAVQMLYPHTSDPENYGQLESLFNTEYLKNKFNALLPQ